MTISLGTGLSCFADHSICSSKAICLARECPLQTVSDRAIGHATGTPPDWRSTGSARRPPVLVLLDDAPSRDIFSAMKTSPNFVFQQIFAQFQLSLRGLKGRFLGKVCP